MVLVLLGVYDALIARCGIYEHLHSFREEELGSEISPTFHFLVLCLVQIKRTRRQGKLKVRLCNSSDRKLLLRPSASCNKLLDRFVFGIMSHIHDGALLQKIHSRCTTGFQMHFQLERCCKCGV